MVWVLWFCTCSFWNLWITVYNFIITLYLQIIFLLTVHSVILLSDRLEKNSIKKTDFQKYAEATSSSESPNLDEEFKDSKEASSQSSNEGNFYFKNFNTIRFPIIIVILV